MPNLSHEAQGLWGHVRPVALKIRNRMNRLGLSESELARRCSLLPGHAAISREARAHAVNHDQREAAELLRELAGRAR